MNVNPITINRTVPVTIATSAQLSSAADLGDARLLAVVIPSNTEGTAITFQASVDGTNYFVIYDTDGSILSYDFTDPCVVLVDVAKFLGFRWLKLDTGTNQTGATATLTLVIG
jgi:hypothetical protein